MKLVLFSLALIILKVMSVFCTVSSALGCMHQVCVSVCLKNDASGKLSVNFRPVQYLCVLMLFVHI